jgi:hypothetical protein
LISEIQEYDDAINQQDKYFVNQDERILGAITKSQGTDEYLNADEKKLLFSQQLRKIMSKNVRGIEQDIRINTAKGIMGTTSNLVDYIMYASIAFVLSFGFISYKKLKDQSDTLVI